MKVYAISKKVLDRDYDGAGTAWAAIKDGKVLAISYEDEAPQNFSSLGEVVRGECSCTEFVIMD